MPSNCGAREDSWVGLQGDQISQSILKEISPEYSLEGLMLKLKLQYFGHLMRRTDSLEKTLMLRKVEDKRRKVQQRRRRLNSITNPVDMNLTTLWEIVKDRGAWRAAVHEVKKSWTQLRNGTIATHRYWTENKLNDIENIMYQNLWDAAKAVLTRRILA